MIDDAKQAAVERYFAAISTQDADALVALFAPGGVMEDPVGARPITDEQGLRRFVAGIVDNFATMVLTPDACYHAGGEVAVHWSARGRSTQGIEVAYSGIDVFAFDADDRITSMRGYWDPKALFAQLAGDA